MALDNIVSMLKDWGFFEIVLPFLLIFVLLFAILEKIKILGKRREINLLVALSVSLIALASSFLTDFIASFLPKIAIALLILVFLLIILNLISPDFDIDVWYMQAIVPIVFIILLFFQFKSSTQEYVDVVVDNGLFWLAIIIIAAIWFIIGSGEKKAKKPKVKKSDYDLKKVGRVKGEELKEGYEKEF